MKKLLLFLFLAPWCAFAQPFIIKGTVIGEDQKPIYGANVGLFNPRDSSVMRGTTTNEKGEYTLERGRPGPFLLKVTYLGYADKMQSGFIQESPVVVPPVVLQRTGRNLPGVSINTQNITTQKGDTTEVNAGAFKVNPDATTEDLVTKMPGVTIQNGKVQAQGEEVKQVLVDGKRFMGDDPSSVLKNLPAEIVDKVQFFDQKSDQSLFTGFSDGNEKKTINIVTKSQFKNAEFGKYYGGVGALDPVLDAENGLYKAGASFNKFKGERRITLLAQSNNINEQNFAVEDMMGMMGGGGGGGRGGGGGMMMMGGGAAGNFFNDQKSGVTTTHAAGINYSNKFKKLETSGSYFFNWSETNVNSDLRRQFFTTQSNDGIIYNETNESRNQNINHRLNGRMEYKIDSLNSFVFTPRLTIQDNISSTALDGQNKLPIRILNSLNNLNGSNNLSYNAAAPILYRHGFKKYGRTISLNVSPSIVTRDGNSTLFSENNFYLDSSGVIGISDTLNQFSNSTRLNVALNTNVTYTEALDSFNSLQVSVTQNNSRNASDKRTFDDAALGAPPITLLSSTFDSKYNYTNGGVTYRYQKDKHNFSVGVAAQQAVLSNLATFPYPDTLRQVFQSVLPNMQWQIKIDKNTNLRFNYTTANNVPSVDQLQVVVNNTNPTQLSTGNAGLKQDYRHNLNGRFSLNNPTNNRNFFLFFGGSVTNNAVVNNTFINNTPFDTTIYGIEVGRGAQLVRPENVNGQYSWRSFFSYGLPVNKIKSNLNFNGGFSYSRNPSIINGKTNFSETPAYFAGLVVTSRISEKIDFSVSSNTTYSQITNSLQTSLNQTYYNQYSKAKVNWMPYKGLVLNVEATHQYNSGLSAGFNQNFVLMNAAVGYKFGPQRAHEVRLNGFDLLKQNVAVSRNATQSYFEDVQTNVLTRYFMVNYTYTFRKFGSGGPQMPDMRMRMMMDMMPMPRH